MLRIWRRHKRQCPARQSCRCRKKRSECHCCRCPLWLEGRLGTSRVRKSLDTGDWSKADRKRWEIENEWEKKGLVLSRSEPEPMTLVQIWGRFLADLEARQLHASTVRKYRLLFRQMKEFAERRGLRFLSEFNLDTLSRFRGEWHDGPRSSGKKLERLRCFFRFAQQRRWVSDNPASNLKAPKVSLRPTLPFTHDEMLRILAALDTYRDKTAINGRQNARRLRGLVLLLRYSAMRIGDAVRLSADHISGNRLFLYTQKTGVAVSTVLPDFVVRALDAMPRAVGDYFFWSGSGQLESAVRSWQTRLRKLFELAKVPNGHAHRFRDTFAVELLLGGVPLERVSVLLGHQSIRITEKHYSPWVHSRQQQLEADLERVWSQDPVALSEAAGTRRAHGKERVQ